MALETINRLVKERLPFLDSGNDSLIDSTILQVFYMLQPLIEKPDSDVENESTYSSLERILVAAWVSHILLTQKSISVSGGSSVLETLAKSQNEVTALGSDGDEFDIQVDQGSGGFTIGTAVQDTGDTKEDLAVKICNDINAGTNVHGYRCEASGVLFTVKAPTGSGSNANSYTLSIVITGGIMVSVNNFSGGVDSVNNTGATGNKILKRAKADVTEAEFMIPKASDGALLNMSTSEICKKLLKEICSISELLKIEHPLCNLGTSDEVYVPFKFSCGFNDCD